MKSLKDSAVVSGLEIGQTGTWHPRSSLLDVLGREKLPPIALSHSCLSILLVPQVNEDRLLAVVLVSYSIVCVRPL